MCWLILYFMLNISYFTSIVQLSDHVSYLRDRDGTMLLDIVHVGVVVNNTVGVTDDVDLLHHWLGKRGCLHKL